jgi:hypothetical protein
MESAVGLPRQAPLSAHKHWSLLVRSEWGLRWHTKDGSAWTLLCWTPLHASPSCSEQLP